MSENASIFQPIKDGDYQTNVAVAHSDISFNSTNFSGSGIAALTALYSKRLPAIGDSKAENDPLNFDGSNQYVTWYHINQQYYKFPYDPAKTFEHASRATEKFLYYSASILSVPYAYIGEKIKAGSVTVSAPLFTLVDDKLGNLRDSLIVSSSFVPAKNLRAYWGFNGQYKRIYGTYGNYTGVTGWASNVYEPDQSSDVYNVDFQPGVEVRNNTNYTASGIGATFNGVDSIISTTFNSTQFLYAKEDDFALSFWVKAPTSQSNVVTTTNSLINNRGTSNVVELLKGGIVSSSFKPIAANAYAWDISIQNQTSTSPNTIIARRSDGTYSTAITSSTRVTGSTYHHVIYQKTGSALQLYVNGILENTSTDNLRDHPINTSNVFFGALNNTYAESYSGSIDEVRVYNKGLTATEIASLTNRDYTTGSLYQTNVAGNVFYRLGNIVVSSALPKYQGMVSSGAWTASLQSTHKIYETEVIVRVPKDILNYSLNPTLVKSPTSVEFIDEMVSGSLTPYVTTIGLYNETGDLLAVAKLGAPLQKRTDVDTSILIRWDS
jgi:hypothetical protein